MTHDELKAFETRATAPKWPALPETLRDTAVVLSRFVRKKGDQNVIDQLQAAADEVEALRADSTALVAEVRRLQDALATAWTDGWQASFERPVDAEEAIRFRDLRCFREIKALREGESTVDGD